MEGNIIDWASSKLQWLLENPGVTWSGIGVYALTLLVSAVVAVASYLCWRKKKSSTNNTFTCNNGEQNNAQGEHAIGKQENHYGVPFEKYEQVRDECERLKVEYGIKDAAFLSFFKILEKESIPCSEWGAKLPEIAFRHKELLQRFEAVQSDDPEVQALKEQAGDAIENGAYDQADMLLAQAKERDRQAEVLLEKSIDEQQAALEKRKLSRAASCVEQAKLQRLQYHYAQAAEYWQEAAIVLPEGSNKERANCLVNAGYDLKYLGQYNDALPLYEQSLELFRKVGNKKGEGMVLNNVSQVYDAWGNYDTALRYLQQALIIQQEIDDNYGEITSLNNISAIYWKQSDFPSALECLEDILPIRRSIKDRAGEAMTLNNISQIYKAQGKYDIALEYLNSSLVIQQEIKDKYGELITLNNIGQVHKDQGNYPVALKYFAQGLAKAKKIGVKPEEASISVNMGRIYEALCKLDEAEVYFSKAVKLMEQLKHPDLEGWRKLLEAVRVKLREQQ